MAFSEYPTFTTERAKPDRLTIPLNKLPPFGFQDMMAHQSQMASDGAKEEDHYWELVWANLVSSLMNISDNPVVLSG